MASLREPIGGITASAPAAAMLARKPIRIEPLVAQELVEIEAVDQRLGLLAFVRLAPGQDKSQRVAEGIDGGVDLRAQSAARTPDRLVIGAPFLRRQHADVHGRWWHR